MPLRLLVFLAWRGLLQSRLITCLLCAAVAGGVAFQIPNDANLHGYDDEIIAQGVVVGSGDVRVRPREGARFRDGDALAARIARRDGVVAAVPAIMLPGAIGKGSTFKSALIVAVDGGASRVPFVITEGRAVATGDGSSIVVGSALAKRIGVAVGEEVQLRVLFGEGAHERVATLGPLILRLKSRDLVQSVLAALPFGLAKWRLIGESARTAQAIDACIHAELAARRAGTVVNDGALAHLVAPRPDGTVATDRELRDQLMTLIFAGHENVATTLAWTFERVLRHPAVLGQLVEPGRDDRYPAAVLMEAMRQRPVIAEVVRELAEPFEHGEHALPIGTHISVAIAALHMRADLFADPEVFRPERFLDDASTTWTTPEAAIYHPFGGGARRCLGADFAMLQLRTIMTTVLAHADLRAPDSAAERGVSNGMAVGPHRGALVVMERRR